MATYNDIYMRAYLGDPGNIPRDQSNPLSASPDLIPYGTSPATPDSSIFLSQSSWGQTYNAALTVNQTNYLYMRAKNLGTQTTTGTFSLYYSPASLLLYPSQWTQNQLSTQQGPNTQSVQIAAGATGVTPSAFVWQPTDPSQGDHYCLVGMVSTPSHPATPPTDGSIQNFADWIANNANFAWHNVSVTDSGSPTWTNKINYNQGTTAASILFQLNCVNVPLNSKVGFSCGTQGPTPPIYLAPTTVTNASSFNVGMTSNVPANFISDISYSYWAGGSPPVGFSITLNGYLQSSSESSIYKYSKTLEQIGMPKPEDYITWAKAIKKWDQVAWSAHQDYADHLHMLHSEMGTYSNVKAGPIKLFSVGSFTTYAQSVSTR